MCAYILLLVYGKVQKSTEKAQVRSQVTTSKWRIADAVVAGESIVQFRVPRSALDLDLLGYVERAYAGFTPHHSSAGREGELYIYTMNNVGGISMYLARDRLFRDNYCLLRETLKDYAK